ncbi:hypothetical protein AABB24_015568 [Solanum stoloniferum]|uniref:DUF659 domain-containing protein n=1 Tax=Solanum stoloniferum TaxID=62892 RepID=A0ABD2TQD8_9SOLN
MLLYISRGDSGVENVVQTVAYTTSGWMMEAGKKLMDRCKTVFWSIDASYCMELMLQEVTKIKEALEKAKMLVQFIYSHATVLKLLRDAFPEAELLRRLVEMLHRKGRNQIEQQRLSDLVFVHCNLQFDPEGENEIAEDV